MFQYSILGRNTSTNDIPLDTILKKLDQDDFENKNK